MRRAATREEAVSEVIGVVLLLAMVLSIMVGVFAVLAPYLDDIDDTRQWSMMMVGSEALEERTQIAADAPNGTQWAFQVDVGEANIRPLIRAEQWTFSADLEGYDRIESRFEGTKAIFQSVNGTMAKVVIERDQGSSEVSINDQGEEITIELTSLGDRMIVLTIYDRLDSPIHRIVHVAIDGLRAEGDLEGGVHRIDLVNGGRVEDQPGHLPQIIREPRLRHQILPNGKGQASIVLLDITVDANASLQQDSSFVLESLGPSTLFDGEGRNVRISAEPGEDAFALTMQLRRIGSEHALFRSLGLEEAFTGFGPEPGHTDGRHLAIHPTEKNVDFTVIIQRVEVLA